MDYGRPTLVTEILNGIASFDNDRTSDDVMLHAAGDVGRLADAVRRSEGAPRPEIAVAAMDLAGAFARTPACGTEPRMCCTATRWSLSCMTSRSKSITGSATGAGRPWPRRSAFA